MKKMTFGGLALVLAALFGMVQFGSPAALALPSTGTHAKKSQPGYHIRTLPGLTGTAHKTKSRAKKEATKLEKATLQKQAFLGTIAKKNGHYVLTAGMFTFKLNDQSQVKKYDGKKVRVTGKLNPQTNIINVKQIKKTSG